MAYLFCIMLFYDLFMDNLKKLILNVCVKWSKYGTN